VVPCEAPQDRPGELAADPIVESHPLVANRDPHFYGSCGSRIGKLGTDQALRMAQRVVLTFSRLE
jgi:hypothetical protein